MRHLNASVPDDRQLLGSRAKWLLFAAEQEQAAGHLHVQAGAMTHDQDVFNLQHSQKYCIPPAREVNPAFLNLKLWCVKKVDLPSSMS